MRVFSLSVIGLLVAVALPVPAASAYKILSECDRSSDVQAEIAQDAPVNIHYAIAGAPTCYSVSTTVAGKEIKGYLLDAAPDAVQAFEKSRAEAEREAFKAAPVPSPPPPAAPTPKAAPEMTGSAPDGSANPTAKDAPKTPNPPPGPVPSDRDGPRPGSKPQKPMSM